MLPPPRASVLDEDDQDDEEPDEDQDQESHLNGDGDAGASGGGGGGRRGGERKERKEEQDEKAAAAPRPRPDAVVTFMERELAGVWRTLFNTRAINRRDDFFALGGHSGRVCVVQTFVSPIKLSVFLCVGAVRVGWVCFGCGWLWEFRGDVCGFIFQCWLGV